MLRNAHVDDVEEMNRLINQFAEKDLMLPRPLSELYEKIRDYYVYVENDMYSGRIWQRSNQLQLMKIFRKKELVKNWYKNALKRGKNSA